MLEADRPLCLLLLSVCRQMPPNLVWGKCAGPMLSTYEPDPRKAAQHMTVTSWKIWLAAKVLG